MPSDSARDGGDIRGPGLRALLLIALTVLACGDGVAIRAGRPATEPKLVRPAGEHLLIELEGASARIHARRPMPDYRPPRRAVSDRHSGLWILRDDRGDETARGSFAWVRRRDALPTAPEFLEPDLHPTPPTVSRRLWLRLPRLPSTGTLEILERDREGSVRTRAHLDLEGSR